MAKAIIHETPSETIVKASNTPEFVKDSKGRTLSVKKMGPLDRLRFFELLGPENSKNEAYVGYSALAYMVTAIDGEELIRPTKKAHLEIAVERLGDQGMDAVAKHLADQAE